MENQHLPIVTQMFDNDAFSQWLGIERLDEKPGYAKVKMQVRKEMTNGFDVAHGGISFSLADSAFAFASNSRGKHAVSIDCSINHLKPVHTDDILIAEAKEESCSAKLATYIVRVTNQDQALVALFKGMVYRTNKDWEV
jgi:acyl-CoA thioesterase